MELGQECGWGVTSLDDIYSQQLEYICKNLEKQDQNLIEKWTKYIQQLILKAIKSSLNISNDIQTHLKYNSNRNHTKVLFLARRLIKVQKVDNLFYQSTVRKIGTLLHCCWKHKMGQKLQRENLAIFNKIMYLYAFTVDPVISFVGSYLEDITAKNENKCPRLLTVALFLIAKHWKQPKSHLHRKLVELQMVN